MKRQIVYPASIPLDTDLLSTNKNAMMGLAFAMQAILGTNTLVDGLVCTPTGPASMQVNVSNGSIYSLQNTDATAYGSLAADTTHSIVKQGISYSTLTLSCPAPVTTGQSVIYLVQAAFQETDTTPVVLPYYNSSNTSTPYSGPANSGSSQNTVRDDQCLVSVKAGTAATTGTQTTPAADSGYVGLWTITVANGQTTITSGNIAVASGAPFIGEKLTQRLAPSKNLNDIADANAARYNLGAAKNGANTDITSLSSPYIANATANLQAIGDTSTKVASTSFVNPAFSIAGTNGYVELASGLILQYGSVVGAVSATFPMTFPNACRTAVATAYSGNTAGPDVVEIALLTTTTLSVVTSRADTNTTYTTGTWYWFAVGN